MGPAGKSATVGSSPTKAWALNNVNAKTLPLSVHIDTHLIASIVKISAGIPASRVGLHSTLYVGGAGQNRVVAAAFWLPGITPQPPGILRLVFSELRRMPTGSAIGRDIDPRDIGF